MKLTESTFKIDFRRWYLEEKIQQYIDSKKGLDNYFHKYKGELLFEHMYRQREYLDFLNSMKKLGFARDEVDGYILSHAKVTEL